MKMLKKTSLSLAACVVMFLMVSATSATAQNMLANPGFEVGPAGGVPPTDWGAFGNAYQEPTVSPQFVPHSGSQLCSMYGNFWGSFNVSGIFQEFPTGEGGEWTMSCWTRHWSGDPMIGSQAEGGNWVVQKIAFFDAEGVEIGGVESIILDGTYATDVWHYSGELVGIAPPNTVAVQALVLYLQPLWDGGAAHIDDVTFEYTEGTVGVENSTWGAIKALDR